MSNLSIAMIDGQGNEKCRADGEGSIWMVYEGEYEHGDMVRYSLLLQGRLPVSDT